ncbi:resolvase [Anaerosporomusa subterranea]|uniref:Resolvase n=1 Tax=Anaerosporomusa subterranea TaxID=1794912 RepID=A0A154BPK4_ANASB|nr:recombinase family protein [Anaerosporomusa subterranea]KYZ75790.1 resolvase [Anaerosporomusa subterranea]
MNIAYIRVSTVEQNTGRQHEALKAHNIEKVFEEKVSGKDTNRPQLKAMLEFARQSDTIYIESISRLARNTLDFLKIVEQLTAKSVSLISLKENINTSTPQGKFMLSVFAALSQLERDTIKQRQREGIDLALKEGRAYGRPKINISDKFKEVYKRWKAKEITAVEAMKLTGTKKNTFYNHVKEIEQA